MNIYGTIVAIERRSSLSAGTETTVTLVGLQPSLRCGDPMYLSTEPEGRWLRFRRRVGSLLKQLGQKVGGYGC